MQQKRQKKLDFTEARIAGLPFADVGKRYMVRDAATKNLVVRVSSENKVYYLVKNIDGKVMFVRLGDVDHMTVKKAREALVENMEVVSKGKNPNDEKRKIRQDMTIKEFFRDVYVPNHSEVATKPASQRTNDVLFRVQLAPFHNKKMLNITHAELDLWHKSLGKKSIYRANRALALIRHMYNKAIVWGLPGDNPTRGITAFREKSRDRFLRPEELPRFFEALQNETNTTFKNYVLLSLFVGQRRGNMFAVRWENVDFVHNAIYIPDTKNNEPQIVPLVDQAIELLKTMKKDATSEWVFPSNRKPGYHFVDCRGAWHGLLARAGIENFRFHDIRRTFGSYIGIYVGQRIQDAPFDLYPWDRAFAIRAPTFYGIRADFQ